MRYYFSSNSPFISFNSFSIETVLQYWRQQSRRTNSQFKEKRSLGIVCQSDSSASRKILIQHIFDLFTENLPVGDKIGTGDPDTFPGFLNQFGFQFPAEFVILNFVMTSIDPS